MALDIRSGTVHSHRPARRSGDPHRHRVPPHGLLGYSDEFMEACRDELTLTEDYIAVGRTTVAEVGGKVAGFSALQPHGDGSVELDYLFVEPGHIGTGVGRALMEHAIASARATA